MNSKEIERFLIKSNTSVKAAMSQLESTNRTLLFIIDDHKKLIGSLSDGDIRRWILTNGSLSEDVINAANKQPFSVNEGCSLQMIKKIIIEERFSAIPICDLKGKITEIIFWDEIVHDLKPIEYSGEIDVNVVIMAGGQGSRLEPFTKILPKPLIPIGDKTITELIIDKFIHYKINHFYLSVNHKAKIIKSYFEELMPSYTIDFVEETKPLGTIGALSLLKGHFTSPVLVTNCDIIIDIHYSDFVNFHRSNNFDISLIGSLMHHKIPYGVCEVGEGNTLVNFKEKPEHSFLASTGMYIFNPEIIDLIPENTFFQINDLMDEVKKNSGNIGVYAISEDSWLDTGEWHEYKKTIEKYNL